MEPGDRFDRYTLVSVLGEGGMGIVYWATDERLGRRVALKVVRKEQRENQAAAARLVREARAAASLEHPNAVAVYDAGEVDGSPFIAMEFVEGKTLRELIGQDAPIAKRVRWMIDVARALAAAHKAGIIHRDVKPENVMVREDGVVKVLDFGIARLAPQVDASDPEAAAKALKTLTRTGERVGTPLYMAPEQLNPTGPVDARIDQFSWGIVAFELFAGKPPWVGEWIAVASQIIAPEPTPLDDLPSDLPDGAREVVGRALEKDREDRFASMDELVVALTNALEGKKPEPVAPPPAPVKLEGGRTKLVAPLLAAAAVAALIAVFFWNRHPAAPPTRTAAPAHSMDKPAATAIAGPLAVTALERQSSNERPAADAYSAGLSAFRDGNEASARESFRKAIELDPSLGAVHLRLALDAAAEPLRAADHFAKAQEVRASLTARDRVLLDAAAPCLQRLPYDFAACKQRFTAALAERANDAELWYWFGAREFQAGAVEIAIGAFEKAIELDPKFGAAYARKAEANAQTRTLVDALATVDACLAAVPAATSCLAIRLDLLAERGACAELEKDAREGLSRNAGDDALTVSLARAELALGKGREAVLHTLSLRLPHIEAEARERARLFDELFVAQAFGDFATATDRGQALEKAVSTSPIQSLRFEVERAQVETDWEAGRAAEAGKWALAVLKAREGLPPNPLHDDMAVASDGEVFLAYAALRGGQLDDAEFSKRQESWGEKWRELVGPARARFVWLYAYALPADNRDRAERALATLEAFGGLPKSFAIHPMAAFVGRTFLRAGRVDEALPFLERSASACTPLDAVTWSTHGLLWLAEAHEAKGDKSAACDVYGTLVARWGDAKPKSVTAEKAKTRMKSLGCEGRAKENDRGD